MNDKTPNSGEQHVTVDLSNCDREPIHLLSRIQSFGALISVSLDWIVNHVSNNIGQYLDVDAEDLIGAPITEIFSTDAIHAIRTRLQLVRTASSVERLFGVTLDKSENLFDVAIHVSDRSIIIELERSPGNSHIDYMSMVRPMVDRVANTETIEALCDSAARQVRAMTGFDRVMVYKFEKDETGTVIAESLKPGVNSYKGLRYPASDIPKQARELYRRNPFRIISDVNDPCANIFPRLNPDGEPLDLSMSVLRAVSPIHIEYLKNMGVDASMSISIVVRGKLWGLFACHNYEPRILDYGLRSASELFGHLFSFLLDQKQSEIEASERNRAQTLHDQIMARLADGATISENFEMIADAIGAVVTHDGIVGWIDGNYIAQGATPTREEFMKLARFLNTAASSRVYVTDALSKVYPDAEDFPSEVAGLLALPVSRTPRDYLVLFRREIARSVVWAGNPNKPVEPGPNGDRLTPRKSFETWKETVRGTSQDWSESERYAAESLRVTLLEVVLRMNDAALRERAQASEKQEILIAELNHRVRNVLNLIRSLVTQSGAEARSVREYTAVVGGRIHSLARAHDQITQQQWNPSSLQSLIRTEAEAYLNDKANRLKFKGDDVLLKPEAFSTLALVFHELMTNSAKYGSLSDASGSVLVTFDSQDDGALELTWQETGGPPIRTPPVRRGFGSTIIERSIPYELKGKAHVDYQVSGLKAQFMIPARNVQTDTDSARAERAEALATKNQETNHKAGLSGDVLLVEDNIIIALDTEEALLELGATRVHVASTVESAMEILDEHTPSLALLDLNLGDETSEPIAERLESMGVTFVFGTGYGELAPVKDRFTNVTFLQKPYDVKDILKIIAK
ncbi:MAG: two-component system sensor histidine kinase/response regulator [Hirschia sp.]|nr:two-component system sensor histidine kinase/response regulator [Hirschia sp.]MBF18358.1 two-component system sensor histidine kinase/response regulator [Hirschia sp.]